MSNKTGLGAYFDGAFSEYDINMSKSMQGYFIISKKGGYNSELIGEDVEELVFKDCTKSIDEIKTLLKNKKLREDVKTHIFASEHGIDENSQNRLNSRFSEVKKTPKRSFEIKEITPDRPAFEIISQNIEEIIAEESKEGALEVASRADEIATLSKTSSETSAKAKAAAIDKANNALNNEILSQNENNEPKELPKNESLGEILGEGLDSLGKAKAEQSVSKSQNANAELSTSQKAEQNANTELSTSQNTNESQKEAEKSSENKIYFAKNIYLPKGKIAEIEILITGYDEFCDSFYFDEIPDECEYKYSIKKGELRALFIADLSSEQARNFISGFSFKTSRQISKHIEIFINAGFSPTFSLTLFN